MKAATLLQAVALYGVLKRYPLKQDIPSDEREFQPLFLNFGLYGNWFVPRGTSGLLTKEGSSVPFHQVHLLTGELIVGHRDLTSADGTKYQSAWRESLTERINSESQLSPVV